MSWCAFSRLASNSQRLSALYPQEKESKKKQAMKPALLETIFLQSTNLFGSFCRRRFFWFYFLFHGFHIDVGENPSGMLIDNNLFLLPDLRNLLRRDDDVASFGCSPHHAHDGQAIGQTTAEALII